MTPEQEKKWSEESRDSCEKHKKNEFDLIRPFEEACYVNGYLAARKTAQVEIDELMSVEKSYKEHTETLYSVAQKQIKDRDQEIERLKGDLDYSKQFHCSRFLTNGSGYISCQVKEKEFKSYEFLLKERDSLIKEMLAYESKFTPSSEFIRLWIEKAQKIIGGEA